MDHAQLVHEQWLHVALTGMQLFIKRVATDDNIADLPSRRVCFCAFIGGGMHFVIKCVVQEFRVLVEMGAVEVQAVLHDVYTNPTTWDEMQERWRM